MNYYDQIMVPRLFDPWAELLLDELGPRVGQTALDIACGPGTVTRRVAQRVGSTGRVTGCDLSPAMLELARAKGSPGTSAPIEYVECAAEALAIPDNTVDLATCQQGLQFFPNRPAAVAEMRRVLRPGGRIGVAVWSDIEDCPPFAALATALGDVFGRETVDTYRSGPWGFDDPVLLLNLFEDGGFTNVRVQTRELPVIFEGGPTQLMLTLRAAAVATKVSELDGSELSKLVSAIEEATRPITSDGAIRSFATSHILTANVSRH